jgi:uronate dehydrogenase
MTDVPTAQVERPRILVTGAAGRLGRTVAELFHDEGYDLRTTDVVDAGDVPWAFERADLRDHVAASALLRDIDVLLHLGNRPGIGSTPPQVVFNDNVSINENVFQGAAAHGVSTIVFASTLQMIGSHPDERTVVDPPARPSYPIDETVEPRPSNVYALSKTVSEMMLRYYSERCGLACTAIRFPLLHRHEPRVGVSDGDEHEIDVFEGFTGLTYHDAARLFLAVVRADLPGYRVYLPGTAHRHRDLSLHELIDRYYPEVPRNATDLVDITTIVAETGWTPSPGYGPRSSAHRRPANRSASPTARPSEEHRP